jgi:FixJ family two-component response regulator
MPGPESRTATIQQAMRPDNKNRRMKAIQRHQVMEKMGASSLAELVRMANRLKVPVPK